MDAEVNRGVGNAGFTLTCNHQPMRDDFAPWWGMEAGPETLEMQAAAPFAVSRRVLLGSMLAGCLLLAGCGWFAERWEWNQKLTVEVSTPEGLRSGSAVSHVSWREANALGNYPADYSGEATVVDMGQGRYLFALIGEETKQIAAHTLHAELGEQRSDYEKLFPKIMSFRGLRDVPRDRYPLLVTFTDINDPKTVRKVDPDNLAATFGPGVSLKRITLEITDEGVTEGAMEKVLPWWTEYENKQLDGNRYNKVSSEYPFAKSINRLNFKRD